MNLNAMLAVRFLVDNKLKLCKIADPKVTVEVFKKENEINPDFKVFDLNNKQLAEDEPIENIFGGRTNVDCNSCLIKIQDPTKEYK